MGRVGFTIAVAMMVALCAGAERARGQCTYEWDAREPVPGLSGGLYVRASLSWDPDNTGPLPPVLVVGGDFTNIAGFPVNNIAMWDGQAWHSFGQGINGTVYSLAVWNGDLIAGGQFTMAGGAAARSVARWNGTTWQPIGDWVSGTVYAIAVFNQELYIGGNFSNPLTFSSRLARWDGIGWQSVGASPSQEIHTLCVYDGTLVAGGDFSSIGGISTLGIARWDGTSWLGFGSGTTGNVFATVVNDGQLFIGGDFTGVSGVSASRVARYDGSSWHALGSGTTGHVWSLSKFNNEVVVGGQFSSAGGVFGTSSVARWNGSAWGALEFGVGGTIYSLCAHDERLVAGGVFWGYRGYRISQYVGGMWRPFGEATNAPVRAMLEFQGTAVAAGDFTFFRGAPVKRITAWDGSAASAAFGSFSSNLLTLSVHDGELHAAGFYRVLRWNGTQWHYLDPAPAGFVNCLTSFGGELYAGGQFSSAGVNAVKNIGRWNGTSWQEVGAGTNGTVNAAIEFEGRLVIGGAFTSAGGAMTNRVAAWNGSYWTPLGTGMNGQVNVLRVFNGQLIAGGTFTTADGLAANRIAKWNGVSWEPLQGNANQSVTVVSALAELGDTLVVGGTGTASNVSLGRYLARWDGNTFFPIGIDTTSPVLSLLVYSGRLLVGSDYPNNPYGANPIYFSQFIPQGDVPAISEHPSSPRVCVGSSISLRSTATGDGALSYRWRKSGVELVDGGEMMGTNTDTLVFVHAGVGDAGEYDCVVKLNDCTQATSNSATLTVYPTNTADGNGDGTVDGRDVQGMVDALVGFSPVSAALCAYELNGDGIVSKADVDAFVGRVLGS